MFGHLKTAAKLNALFAFLGLGIGYWMQSQRLDELRAENYAQAQALTRQRAVIADLQSQAEENRRLTEQLTQAETQARSEAHAVIQQISPQTQRSDAFNADAPRPVVEFLQKP